MLPRVCISQHLLYGGRSEAVLVMGCLPALRQLLGCRLQTLHRGQCRCRGERGLTGVDCVTCHAGQLPTLELYVTLKREDIVKDKYIVEKTLEGLPMAAAVFFRWGGLCSSVPRWCLEWC